MIQERILLITDDALFFQLLCERLNQEGYKVVIASTDDQVLQQISELSPHVILLDEPRDQTRRDKVWELALAIIKNHQADPSQHIPICYLFDLKSVQTWQEKGVLHINFGRNYWAVRSDVAQIVLGIERCIRLYHNLRKPNYSK